MRSQFIVSFHYLERYFSFDIVFDFRLAFILQLQFNLMAFFTDRRRSSYAHMSCRMYNWNMSVDYDENVTDSFRFRHLRIAWQRTAITFMTLIWEKNALDPNIYFRFLSIRQFSWPHQNKSKVNKMKQIKKPIWLVFGTRLRLSKARSWIQFSRFFSPSNGKYAKHEIYRDHGRW